MVAALVAAFLAAPATVGATGGAARAQVHYIPWSAFLPGWTTEYVPTSENDCAAGRSPCVKQTIRELNRVLQSTGRDCHHHAVFALAYTRITQTFAWTGTQPGYYDDVRFANHQSAVFARLYTNAYYNWRQGNRAAVPKSWLMTFDAAAAKKVSGSGDLLLGMNAHINRDLAYVIAAVGMIAPDGSSRKEDFDKVEEFLADASVALMLEAAQRFDPAMDDGRDPLDLNSSTIMQMISVWRENAWRNAEALVTAPTAEARALVEARIESQANQTAEAIMAATRYAPPLTSSSSRDAYCAVHSGDAAPSSYPFGDPDPYGA